MTRFEKDYRDALEGNETEVRKRRKEELNKLRDEFRKSHGFRRECLAGEIARRQSEYDKIDSLI